jgi:hypothetical protein
MVPVRLLAGMLRARAMLDGKAAVTAAELKSCRNVRRSVAKGRASLVEVGLRGEARLRLLQSRDGTVTSLQRRRIGAVENFRLS